MKLKPKNSNCKLSWNKDKMISCAFCCFFSITIYIFIQGYLFPLSARLNPVVSPPPPAVSPAGGQQPDLSLANNSALRHTSPAVNPTITTTSLHHVIHSSGNTRPQFQSNPMLASNVINRAFVGSSHVISPGSLMSTSVQSRPDNNHTMSQNNSAVSQHQTNPVAVSQHQTNPVAVSQHQTNGGNQQNQLFSGQGKFARWLVILLFSKVRFKIDKVQPFGGKKIDPDP